MIRVLEISHPKDLGSIMRQIKVDPYGIGIMRLKGITRLIRVRSISNITANILKQEMLSLGADAAIARGALTGRDKKTDCLLMANDAQLGRLKSKLKSQPFGLGALALQISEAMANYEKENFTLKLGAYKLSLKNRTRVIGIVNLTPDSFSGDGQLSAISYQLSALEDFTQKMIEDGADIIDIGGESSRPGAKPVSAKEESARIMPAIKLLAKRIKAPISVDTYKPAVAREALDCGASMINDISGLRNPKMARIAARYNAAVVIMHMKGAPRNMQKNPKYKSLLDEIAVFLNGAIGRAVAAGIATDKIIIDPGIGFGKTPEDNLKILKNLRQFKTLGKPILAGPSRKSFIGKILRTGPAERIPGTLCACILAAKNGAKLLRVHDVKEVKQALKVWEAVSYS